MGAPWAAKGEIRLIRGEILAENVSSPPSHRPTAVNSGAMPRASATDPRFAEIESHRPYLVRYALAQLLDAALESIDGFDKRSTLRTWLTSILRFKVIDIQRRLVAERQRLPYDEAGAAAEHEAWLDEMFDETGHWRSPPQAWNDPEAALEQARFWEVFERCLARLPA